MAVIMRARDNWVPQCLPSIFAMEIIYNRKLHIYLSTFFLSQ